MDNLFEKKVSLFYETDECQIVYGDSFKILPKMKPESIDMIFADPPYFLSNDGITCKGGKMVSVNKGSWDEGKNTDEKHKFNRKWIRLCKRVLKPNGSIWISGTLHNVYSIGMALEQEGFKIINNITWQKTNPPPNLACRCFTHSTETILWAQKNDRKSRHFFNYELMKEKPEYLLERIILAATKDGDVVLDPFSGSGTAGVVANKLGRKFIGIENKKEYVELMVRRMQKIGK